MSKIQTSELNNEPKNEQLLVTISEEFQETICGGSNRKNNEFLPPLSTVFDPHTPIGERKPDSN